MALAAVMPEVQGFEHDFRPDACWVAGCHNERFHALILTSLALLLPGIGRIFSKVVMISEILSFGQAGGPEGWVLVVLAAVALAAGFVDAVVGGGGLVAIPALFSFVPQASPAALFGTNKIAAISGTLVAASRYARAVQLPWNAIVPALVGAAVFGWLGAAAVSFLPRALGQPLVLVMLVIVAVITLRKKEMGAVHAPRLSQGRQRLLGLLVGSVLGFYDGFFGPGTGAFLVFVFVRFFGYDFLHASASSKVVNVMTNLAALAFFLPAGEFFLKAAVLMALCNIVGAWLGTHLAVKKGSQFVRRFFLVLLAVLIARMAWGTLEMFL